jgi:hypothetical protein
VQAANVSKHSGCEATARGCAGVGKDTADPMHRVDNSASDFSSTDELAVQVRRRWNDASKASVPYNNCPQACRWTKTWKMTRLRSRTTRVDGSNANSWCAPPEGTVAAQSSTSC